MFPHIGTDNPNWLSYFSERLKPPTSIYIYMDCSDPHCIEGDLTGLSHPMICLNPRIWVPLGSHRLINQIPYLMTFGPVYQLLCQDSLWREHQQQHLLPEALHFANQRFQCWAEMARSHGGNWVAGLATMYTDSLKSGLTKVFGSAVLLQPERFQCRLLGATKRAASC